MMNLMMHCYKLVIRDDDLASNKRLFSNDLRIAQCLKSFKMKTVALRVVLKASLRPRVFNSVEGYGLLNFLPLMRSRGLVMSQANPVEKNPNYNATFRSH